MRPAPLFIKSLLQKAKIRQDGSKTPLPFRISGTFGRNLR